MVEGLTCTAQMNQKLSKVGANALPQETLLNSYLEILKERVIVDADGKEIGNRLKVLITKAQSDARQNQKEGEPFPQAIVRNALRILNYNYCEKTPGGLPTGPAYERPYPNQVSIQNLGHEKVPYPMSDYSSLSFLPLGGLGAPICEIDYSTCYLKEGFMVQDTPIRTMTVTTTVNGQEAVTYDLAKANGAYYALYPFSERTYDLSTAQISVLQYSPVIPGDYQTSSLPVEITELTVFNPTEQEVTVTFTLSQENILGWYPKDGIEDKDNPHASLVWNKQDKGNFSEVVNANGNTALVYKKEGNPEELVRVGSGFAGSVAISTPNTSTNAAVEVDPKTNSLIITITLKPGETISQPIAAAYDLPFYNFQYKAADPESPGVRMPKFYARFYGETGQNAAQIAADALSKRKEWREKLSAFQKLITDDKSLPDFFKQALLNELYVLPETGIWEADGGRFAYLESIDYKMYNTSDVNSYTWALLTLYPELERRDLLELANMVPLSAPKRQWWGTDRWAKIPGPEWKHLYWAPTKDKGAVCHDLGGLLGEGNFPFTNTCNEFNWSNANMWIDLAPKFALRAWRYYVFMERQTNSKDTEFIKAVFPAVKMALDTLERRWGDPTTHVPISKGIPDWTYDTISGHGYTPNVVTQWLAALDAAQQMAQIAKDTEAKNRFNGWLEAGKPVMDQLWNEAGYYNAFVSPDKTKINENLHSDMLFGDFYARMNDASPVVANSSAAQALEKIYTFNGIEWSRVGNHGPLGLVNLRGARAEQNFTEQGDEGWTGTMLLNAAYQIKFGLETKNQSLIQNGWNIVQGFYNVVYSSSPDSQYWFGRTPEGYVNPDDKRYNDQSKPYGNETGRAPKYMRALAIWAVYAAAKENTMPFRIYNGKISEPIDSFPKPYSKP